MDERNHPGLEHLDQTIEDALRTLPVMDPPPALLAGIMAQVQPRPVIEKPVFRVGWMDFALSLFFAGMIGMAMLLTIELPPEIRMRLSMHLQYLELLHFDWMLWAAMGMSMLACVTAGVVFSSSQINRSVR